MLQKEYASQAAFFRWVPKRFIATITARVVSCGEAVVGRYPGTRARSFTSPSSQRLEPLKTFEKPLSCLDGPQPSPAAEAVSRRHVTPFNWFRRLSPYSV